MMSRRHVHITGGIEGDEPMLRAHMMRSHGGDSYALNAGIHKQDHAHDAFSWFGVAHGTEDETALD